VLHHVSPVDEALSEARRVTKNGGSISIYLTCDPGVVYRAIRHFVSHKKQAKLFGKSMSEVKFLWAIEHPNHFPGILHTIRHIYGNDEITISRRPFPLLPWNFNIYNLMTITVSK